jgi:beta-glucosidase
MVNMSIIKKVFRGTIKNEVLATLLILFSFAIAHAQDESTFRDATLPVDRRVELLLRQLTIEEKIALLGYNSPGVPRLNIPHYNWWNESLHGVARAGTATVFPQAIAMAATFNDSLVHQISTVISTEARAKYNMAIQRGNRLQYMGLTFWSPNINLFRDPRWGRGQETYGEDPFLTSRMGAAYIKGMQGTNSRYLKTSACAKHFAVHSGPEANRHTFNAVVDEKDLRETYLYAFKHLVDNGVESIMCAYNRVNDEPCCTGPTLLQSILRNEWKFQGHVVTDCGALNDVWTQHKVLKDAPEVAAAAVKAGVNIDCSSMLQDDLATALQRKLINEADINSALTPSLRTQCRLGFFDAPEANPFHNIGAAQLHSPANIELARTAAAQSMVLLKNKDNILPLNKDKFRTILIAGTNAASLDALVANYHGISDNMVTFVEGLASAADISTGIQYDLGCDYNDTTRFGGIWASIESDATIVVIGLTPVLEGEEGDAFLAPNGGDKANLDLPAAHVAYVKALRKKHKKPIIAVITAGSAVDISAIEPYVDAIVLAWYPGEQGGNALGDVIFGKVSPSGRLPVTFYNSLQDLPPYDDYSMRGRTYRYFSGKVQYPFGFGLSYGNFDYAWQRKPMQKYAAKDTIQFSVTVSNSGIMDADEAVQIYIQYPTLDRMPIKELKAFHKGTITRGGSRVMSFAIPISELKKWDSKSRGWKLYPGEYTLHVSHDAQDARLSSVMHIKN